MSYINYKNLSLVLLRVGMGGLFLWAGVDKLTAPFSAAGYLSSASGPLAEVFKGLAGNQAIDLLVAWGLTLGGAALVAGIFTRLASVGLVTLMGLIYLSHFPPKAPDHLIDQHIIFILVLLVTSVFEAGKTWGLGKALKLPDWLS